MIDNETYVSNDMIDVHCHILPGIDDGSNSIEESVKMLENARENGIKTIIATPHVKDRDFDFKKAEIVFNELSKRANELSIEMKLGYEVNYDAIVAFGIESYNRLKIADSNSILLEFNNSSFPANWQYTVKKMTSHGLNVIIAHPERYKYINDDITNAKKLIDAGCQLQCDAFVFDMGRFNKQRRTAYKLLNAGYVSWISTDAHSVEDYKGYKDVIADLGNRLTNGIISFG